MGELELRLDNRFLLSWDTIRRVTTVEEFGDNRAKEDFYLDAYLYGGIRVESLMRSYEDIISNVRMAIASCGDTDYYDFMMVPRSIRVGAREFREHRPITPIWLEQTNIYINKIHLSELSKRHLNQPAWQFQRSNGELNMFVRLYNELLRDKSYPVDSRLVLNGKHPYLCRTLVRRLSIAMWHADRTNRQRYRETLKKLKISESIIGPKGGIITSKGMIVPTAPISEEYLKYII